MSEIVLQAEVRNHVGKRAKSVRYEGKIPGVYYAHGENNINLSTTFPGLKPLIYTSATHIINLTLNNGETKKCILRDVQFDAVTDKPVHFDLQGIKENEVLTVDVPVILVGTPQGVKDGGMLQHIMHRVKVSCLPKHIPEHIEINVAELKINDSVHVKDLSIANVKFVDSEFKTLVSVIPPVVEKEETPGEQPTTAEPEVISKGKKPAEGEEAATPAKAAPAKK